jgi:hypothetical protein
VEAGEPQAPSETLVSAEPDGLTVVEALAADAVRAGRVVVLMERHALPETRWAGVRLLPALRRAGATHLAFETSLQAPLDRARREGTVRSETIPYAFEPSRAALIRTAIRAGLDLVAFDHPTDPEVLAAIARRQDIPGINGLRERWMAESIRRLVSDEPRARVVVWTGGQHAWKRMPDHYSVPLFSAWARDPTMAAVLTEVSGREPYCVGQAVVRGPAHREPGAVRASHPWAAEHGLDAILVHVRGPEPRRPSWIDADRRPVTLATGGARLVQAVPETEGPDAVPAAQAVARDGRAVLTLVPGSYLCRGVDDSDHPVWRRSLRVPP